MDNQCEAHDAPIIGQLHTRNVVLLTQLAMILVVMEVWRSRNALWPSQLNGRRRVELRCAVPRDKGPNHGRADSARHTWEVKTEGAARISAVVQAGRGQ
jgi:hypothetical protein